MSDVSATYIDSYATHTLAIRRVRWPYAGHMLDIRWHTLVIRWHLLTFAGHTLAIRLLLIPTHRFNTAQFCLFQGLFVRMKIILWIVIRNSYVSLIRNGVTGPLGRPVARGGGGGRGGRTTPPPPQLPIPKILFHPLAILFHPLAILFHLSAILFHPLAILFHPSAILFHGFSNFVPPLEYVDDVTRAMSKGGGGCLWMSKSGGVFQIDDVTRAMAKGGCLWMSKSGGVFQIDDVTRTMSKGGCAWCSTHPSSDRPPTWLAGYGPVRPTEHYFLNAPLSLM